MEHILIFPGQGYQNIDMLDAEVQQFCVQNGLYNSLNEVLKDHTKLFDTQYAQPLIIATQIVKSNQYLQNLKENDDIIFAGFSLGEITALIQSGMIDSKEGIEFAQKRGECCKKFSEGKRKYGVVKVPYTKELQEALKKWNSSHKITEQISITNYMPAANGEEVTITGIQDLLRENIEQFGGEKEQEMAIMQCPFHSSSLMELVETQERIFNRTIKSISQEKARNVISTRTATAYSTEMTKGDISNALAQYLIQPIQTTRTLQFIKENYPDAHIGVTMGEQFTEDLRKQYIALGGSGEQVQFIGTQIKAKEQENEKA